ncbi:MAG: 6-phosphogluconolactonase [Deltaproteobacteria bacterium]|jgi:glucosamine-6-phosphate deaminase|nr:6-phosphogluconolactonase [Deltaproteobacteria bacterium]
MTTIYITRDFDQMSHVAARLAGERIAACQATKGECVLGLATGNSPTGMYKHLAKAFNGRRIDARRIRSFNLDEYIGLPGGHAQQRALNCNSYGYFMIAELFALLQDGFVETSVPYGVLVEQAELVKELAAHPDSFEMQGTSRGKAVVIHERADGYLREIKERILDAYQRKIEAAGGIDLQVIGVGGRGHVAFHESGIPFAGNSMLLVKLDDDTIDNAVQDGNFASREQSPQYAVSMGAELVYKAKTVLLLANGARKTGPVAEALLGEVTCDVPISYGQKYAADGGEMLYVLDEVAAADLLRAPDALRAKGCGLRDLRGEPYEKVENIRFSRDPKTNRLG